MYRFTLNPQRERYSGGFRELDYELIVSSCVSIQRMPTVEEVSLVIEVMHNQAYQRFHSMQVQSPDSGSIDSILVSIGSATLMKPGGSSPRSIPVVNEYSGRRNVLNACISWGLPTKVD